MGHLPGFSVESKTARPISGSNFLDSHHHPMRFRAKQVVPANGKYFVELLPLEEETKGGILIPKVTDAQGRPATTLPQAPVVKVIAVGGPAAKGTTNQQMPEYEVGDLLLLSIIPPCVPLQNEKGDITPHGFVDFYQALAKLRR